MEICMVLIFACVLICVKSQDDITVNTQLGTIKGARRRELLPNLDMTVYEFRKIPFAKPPEGDLRFEKPVPYGPWNGILDATQYSPSCYQALGELEAFLQNKNISEDCLYLNIHVPYSVSSSNSKSVMVWIHGGGYSTGQASLYDGAYLAVLGDVIVVTVNYRLNVFGFFSYGDIKGNFGLWDQKLAIQWVNDNIQSFGGNKQSITIFGESAGGFSVGLHSIIPSNQGLFQRAILQSGTAMSTYTTGIITKDASKTVAYSLNCSQTESSLLKRCLKNVPVDVLFKASQKKDFTFSTLLIPFAPVIDGDLLTDNPKDILLNTVSAGYAFYRTLDVVFGTVTGESKILINIFKSGVETFLQFNVTDHIPRRVLCTFLAPDIAKVEYKDDFRVSKAICEKYGQENDSIDLSLNILNAYSDFLFDIPSVRSLRAHQNGNGRQFQYLFSTASPIPLLGNNPPWFKKAEHGSDVFFEFPNTSFLKPAEMILTKKFIKYLTNFAKTGHMNVTDLPQWKEYDTTNEHYLNFDLNITPGQHLYKDRVDFWLNYIPGILKGETMSSAASSIQQALWTACIFVAIYIFCV